VCGIILVDVAKDNLGDPFYNCALSIFAGFAIEAAKALSEK